MNAHLPIPGSGALLAVGQRFVRTTGFVSDAWSAMTSRGWLWVLIIGSVLWLAQNATWNQTDWDLEHNWGTAFHLIAASCFYLALLIADHVPDSHPGRSIGYVLAVLVAALLAVLIVTLIGIWFGDFRFETKAELVHHVVTSVALFALPGGLAVLIYVRVRSERRTRARFAQAELERISSERHVLASRLAAMQAQVEPRFLFNTLVQIESLYDRDPDTADRVLDSLIAYLRAMLPQLREESSTLGREITLVESYLAVIRGGDANLLELDLDVPTDLRDIGFPPMVLLPLIEQAIGRWLDTAQGHTMRISGDIRDHRLQLEFADSGIGFAEKIEGDCTASVRERLTVLFGTQASLVLRAREGGGTSAVMEIPYEPTAGVPELAA
jgi:sensor histidine kinase YesM